MNMTSAYQKETEINFPVYIIKILNIFKNY